MHFYLVLLISPILSFGQTGYISGYVYDSLTKAPLAFVSVAVKESKSGAVSDIDGHFKIPTEKERTNLAFSYVGYKSKQVAVEFGHKNELKISLEPVEKQLEAVIISNRENPAHRIIRLLQKNKRINDPLQQPSFSYNAYTIAALGSGDHFWNMNRSEKKSKNQVPDIPVPRQKMDTTKNKKGAEIARRFKDNYLMLMESYTKRIFRFPNQTNETVLATKVSGMNNPAFAATGSNFQPFGFYKDYLAMNNNSFVSPVIDGSINMYKFRLEDEVIHGNDTSFIISYEPKKGTHFNGLKGLLYINSDKYAIENVIARPADEKGLIFSFRIQQKYSKGPSHWFPEQFNSTLTQRDLKADSVILYWDTRCYISNVEIGNPVPRSNFSDVQLDYHPLAGKRPDSAWILMRTDTLNAKERNTYETFEMLPTKYKNIMGKANTLIQVLAIEAIPWKKIDLPFKYILSGINKYETFRLGLGVQTNPSFSKFLKLAGFAGYGLKDKAWKYGANIELNFHERTGTTLTFLYARDIKEPGNVSYFVKNGSVFSNQSLRNFQTSRMDSIEQYQLEVSTRLRPFILANAWIMNEQRSPAIYPYEFRDDLTKVHFRSFHNTEVGMGLRITDGESYIKLGRAKLRSKPAATQLLVQFSKGIENFWNGQLDYFKAALQFNHSFRFKKLGVTTFQVDAGQVWGNVPYSYLFNLKASRVSNKISIYIPQTFQTAGLYEFAADRTFDLFIQHNFGNLLLKPANTSIRPEILLIQNISFGSLHHETVHRNIEIKTPEKGLYESGLVVRNLYRTSILSVAYLGLGGGVFYRYGYYELPRPIDNWAFKWGFSISF